MPIPELQPIPLGISYKHLHKKFRFVDILLYHKSSHFSTASAYIPPMPWFVSCVTFPGVWLRSKTLRSFPKEKRCRIQSASRFCKMDKPNVQRAAKDTPQRMYIRLKNNRLIAYRIGIRVRSTAYGSVLPIASITAVTRKGLIPHRYAPRKYSVSFSATAGSRSPSTKNHVFCFLQHFRKYSAPKTNGSNTRQAPCTAR